MTRASRSMALLGADVLADPASAPLRRQTVLLEGETIIAVGASGDVAIPPDAERIDCSGCTIVAGFWNCHVHFFERKWLDAASIPEDELALQLSDFTRYGFTTVFDLSSLWVNTNALRERIDRGVAGPRILTTGEGLIAPGTLPPKDILRLLGTMETPMPEIADAASARRAARAALDKGVDALKLFASSQTGVRLEAETMRTAVEQAHAQHKPVFVHVNAAADIRCALEAGADILAHTTPSSGAWDDALLDAMQRCGVALTPTLTLWQFFTRHDRLSVQQRVVDAALAQLREWHRKGGDVVFGTDYGAVGPDPGTEYALMHEAGMDLGSILDSLTTAPARRFGESHVRGRVAPGMQADLTVLGDEPAMNLSALASVRYTVRRGEIVYRG